MYAVSKPSIKDVQMAILEIYKELARIFTENDLRYFAIGGTCIGAVRHKGFIPWDDDIDIAMPNLDYQRFIEMAEDVLPPHLKLCTPTNTENYNNLSIRVHNINTTFIENHIKTMPGRYMGVFVDIMPLYGVPDEKQQQIRYMKKIGLYKSLNHKRKFPFSECPTINSKVLYIASFPINSFVSENYWYYKWKKHVSKYDFDSSNWTGYVWWNSPSLVFPKEDFASFSIFPFEDTIMRVPVGYDDFLKRMFGDYMQLPPQEQRVNHSAGNCVIDLNRSYSYYVQEYKRKGKIE